MIKSLEFLGLPEHSISSNSEIWVKERLVKTANGDRVFKKRKATTYVGSNGYLMCTVRYKQRVKGFSIHRTLAIAFKPNPKNYPIVHHKDGNKLNNSLKNLQWTSSVSNIRHALSAGLSKRFKGEFNKTAKLTNKKAEEIKFLIKEAKLSYVEIGKKFNVSASTIADVKNGRVWGNERRFSLQELEDCCKSNCFTFSSQLLDYLKKSYAR